MSAISPSVKTGPLTSQFGRGVTFTVVSAGLTIGPGTPAECAAALPGAGFAVIDFFAPERVLAACATAHTCAVVNKASVRAAKHPIGSDPGTICAILEYRLGFMLGLPIIA